MNNDDPRVEENFGELSRLLAHSSDPDFIAAFLRCLLTSAETADIAARWALVKDLQKHFTQREIAKYLGISLCMISRGSRVLKKTGSAFQRMLDILEAMRKRERTPSYSSGAK
jgi:TrpR family trp operon transcriptional repressor